MPTRKPPNPKSHRTGNLVQDLTQNVFDQIAAQTDDPFVYVMATVQLGFTAYEDKVRIVQTWNQFHPDKPLPDPVPPVP
jgi:hypothetical protein